MRIGVQVISRDRPQFLGILLSSLLRQTHKQWDLILVDNSVNKYINDHAIKSFLNRLGFEGHRVKYIEVDSNIRDIGQLRNMALDNDNNLIGCRIDDDSWCEPDYFKELFYVIKDKPSVGAVGGLVPVFSSEKVYSPPKTYINKIDEFYDLQGEADQCAFYNQDNLMEADHLRSSFMYWNEVAKKIRHPECMGRTGYREETDLTYRIKLSGYQLLVNPKAVCWHLVAPSGGGRDITYNPMFENVRMFKRRMIECEHKYGLKNQEK